MWTFLNGKWTFVPCAPNNDEGAEGETELEEGEESTEGDEGAEEGEESTEGDEGAEEGEESTEGDEGHTEPAKKETRVQRLANEARKERERGIALETELRVLREQKQLPTDTGEAARIRAEKLALMDATERKLFEQDETIQRLQQGQQFTQVQMADYADKTRYETIAGTNTPKGQVYAKHKDWVEKQLIEERKLGRNPNREALLMLKVGHDAINTPPKKQTQKEKEAAAARVKVSKAAPTSARTDVGSKKSGGDDLASLRARILERERLGATS